MKRFYTAVDVKQDGADYRVLLDGKAIRTPDGTAITAPTRALAESMQQEWASQGEVISLQAMPMTRLAASLMLMDDVLREQLREECARYGQTDLLCYWSDDRALQQRQQEQWEPVLQWLQSAQAIRLERTCGIMPVAQDPQSLAALSLRVAAWPDGKLLAYSQLVPLLGSLVLVLAVEDGHLSLSDAAVLSQLDETYQEEKWGQDDEIRAARAAKNAQIEVVGQFLLMLGQ